MPHRTHMTAGRSLASRSEMSVEAARLLGLPCDRRAFVPVRSPVLDRLVVREVPDETRIRSREAEGTLLNAGSTG